MLLSSIFEEVWVEVPADSRVHEIGEDYVVLIRLGEFDVTYVEFHDLWR